MKAAAAGSADFKLLLSHRPSVARAAAEDQVAGFGTGADAYLVKPFDPSVLEACVANLLTQRRRLRERFRLGESPVADVPDTVVDPVAPVAEPSALERRLRPLVEARLTDPGLDRETLSLCVAHSR